MEKGMENKSRFSSPKMEDIFKSMVEVSGGDNILLKIMLHELVVHARHEIEEEAKRRDAVIKENQEKMEVLKGAFQDLRFIDEDLRMEKELYGS